VCSVVGVGVGLVGWRWWGGVVRGMCGGLGCGECRVCGVRRWFVG